MEKLAEVKKTMWAQFFEENPNSPNHKELKIYPEMPMEQIQHYIKLAARKNNTIIVQFNPSSFSKEFTEVTGKIKLSPQSSQVIITPKNEQTIHLIQPRFIRHIRLAKY